ncbi:MAG: sulfotransferase [Nitrospirae bacterium]|nr:sulfotransferase [Nitrospirota bacterium]
MHNLPSGNPELDLPMLLITGAARSGTGILGRILGSCENTVFAYEPPCLPAAAGVLATGDMTDAGARFLLDVCLHEVEFYPRLLGRRVNLRPGYSFSFNYLSWDKLIERLGFPDRRREYHQLRSSRSWSFVFKHPDLHLIPERMVQWFPRLKVIHLIRDGRDVVASGLRRAWYSDTYYREWVTTWFRRGSESPDACPFFVEERYRSDWSRWNPATRAAYNWCRMVQAGLEGAQNEPVRVRRVKYEELVRDVEGVAGRLADWAGLELSGLSRSHMRGLEEYHQVTHDHVFDLAPAVRDRFNEFCEDLGYAGGGGGRRA